ncbi:MAG: hypothetical protein K2X55_13050 [Burkholderiaceae bacterium]|nr:hypothetical protein [Burkholderiaceae bacterium]
MSNDLEHMSDTEYAEWLAQASGMHIDNCVSEESLARMIGEVMREPDPRIKSQSYLDIANLAIALADKVRGVHVLVTTSLTLTRH